MVTLKQTEGLFAWACNACASYMELSHTVLWMSVLICTKRCL